MDREEVMFYIFMTVVIIGTVIAVTSGIIQSIEEDEYVKECERKAILYDYIMEQNGDGE